MSDILCRRRLQWLGHVTSICLQSDYLKNVIWVAVTFQSLRWKDLIQADLKLSMLPLLSESFRYETAKCIVERQLPLCEQPGTVQCAKYHRWLGSRGGLAVHKGLNVSSSSLTMPSSSTQSSIRSSSLGSTDCTSSWITEPDRTCCCCHCSQCGRCFKSKPGFQRHNCHRDQDCS